MKIRYTFVIRLKENFVNKYIIGIISVIIASTVIFLVSYQDQNNSREMIETEKEQMKNYGDFRIDKSQYNIGEKIFLDMDYIDPEDKGTILILRPINDTHRTPYITIPFNGANTDSYSYYFEARLNEDKGVCSTDDLVGIWSIVFYETNYTNIEFEIKDQISDWDDRNYEPIC